MKIIEAQPAQLKYLKDIEPGTVMRVWTSSRGVQDEPFLLRLRDCRFADVVDGIIYDDDVLHEKTCFVIYPGAELHPGQPEGP